MVPTPRILLIEDQPSYVDLIREASEEADFSGELVCVDNGEEAIQYLEQQAPFQDAPPPHIILLDLNLPRLNGKEILQYLKYHPRLKVMPIIVLTTSEAESDVWESYARYANAYIVKPADLDAFFQVIQMTLNYWCRIVTLPHLRDRPSSGSAY